MNTELAYKTLDAIRDDPRKWDQKDFFCGTTACFAGHAILIHYGFTSEAQYRNWQLSGEDFDFRTDTGMVAGEALGWNDRERDYVFGCMTTDFDVLESVVKDVLNGELR